MAEQFYVECDMQGNFLISDDEEPIFLILYSEQGKRNICWRTQLGHKKPQYYFLDNCVFNSDDTVSIITHDADYFTAIKQVCTNTYPGTITLAYEDLTTEIL